MNSPYDAADMLRKLEEYLALFREFSDQIFGNRDAGTIEENRSRLRRQGPLITDIVTEVSGISYYGIRGLGNLSSSNIIGTALLGGNNDMTHNFVEHDSAVTSMLERAIGTLETGLWPPKTSTPLLEIRDKELRERCEDLLSAPGNYDRVIREATTVLEVRIRSRCPFEILAKLIPNSADQAGENLVNKLFAVNQPVLSVSNDRIRRASVHKILIGIFSYLRNPYHHNLDSSTQWSWAWSTAGLIDRLLDEVESSELSKDSV